MSGLLRNHKAKDDQDLVEAEDLVDELKQLQPDQLNTLILQVEVDRARNQIDKAVELIQTTATRSGLAPLTLKTLAELAEKLGRVDVAEPLYRRYAALPNVARRQRLCGPCSSVVVARLKRHWIFASRSGRTLGMPR